MLITRFQGIANSAMPTEDLLARNYGDIWPGRYILSELAGGQFGDSPQPSPIWLKEWLWGTARDEARMRQKPEFTSFYKPLEALMPKAFKKHYQYAVQQALKAFEQSGLIKFTKTLGLTFVTVTPQGQQALADKQK